MQGGIMVMEPIRLSSVLSPSNSSYLPPLTKIVGTLGPKSRSVEVIEECLKAGMSVARFDFSWLDGDYHQETLENLRTAVKNTKKLCSVMLDTVGPELQIHNRTGNPVELKADSHIIISPDVTKETSSEFLPVNYTGLSETVKKGDTIFLGQYLFTGSQTTSVWLEVAETKGSDVICLIKNSAALTGFIFTIHVCQVRVNLPTLTDNDKKVISSWGSRNNVDLVSLSYTRHADDLRELRGFLKTQNLHDTQVFAKIETIEGLKHFDDILKEADGVILGRGNLGLDVPPEKVFFFQKSAVMKCNMAGKPVIISRVVDTMTENLRPTRAEATDVANAVLDGTDGILLGAETLQGQYPIETVKTVGKICAEAERVYNESQHFKRLLKHVGESIANPGQFRATSMSHAESVASSAVRAAVKTKAAMIIVFTSMGGAARLIAKYRPPMPVIAIVVPRLQTTNYKWTFSGSSTARQLLGVRGVYPILASSNTATSGGSSEEVGLKAAYEHGKSLGLLKPNDQVVVFEKVGDSSMVKIVQLQY